MTTITLFYASLLALWLVVLSWRVIAYRRKHLVELGTSGDRELAFRVRAHGNLTEHAPIALILLGLIEMQSASLWLVHALGLMLLAGRLLHGWSFSFANGRMSGRATGVVLTFTMIGISALIGLFLAVS